MEPRDDGPAVVVGVEGLPDDRFVLVHAADLAARLRGRLHVVHAMAPQPEPVSGLAGPPVVPAGEPEADAEGEGEAFRQAVDETLATAIETPTAKPPPWTFHAAPGEGARVLLQAAQDTDAYCVVLGSRGEGFGAFLDRLARPSISHAVIRESTRPVMVVADTVDDARAPDPRG